MMMKKKKDSTKELLPPEIVISPILDSDIQSNIEDSPIWKSAYMKDEITLELYHQHKAWYKYSIKFKGLTPVQCTNIESFSF